jgi:triosephosphate isomerase (TIM)
MIYVNFKTYSSSTGDNAVKLALACELAHDATNVPIIPVVTAIDLWRVTQHTDIPIWIQHVDYCESDAHGTLLSHSEHALTFSILEKTVVRIRNTDPDFKIMICVPTLETLKQAATLVPDYLAYEPPELIGSSTVSVATEKASVIADAVKASGTIPLIVGAGIKEAHDIKVSLEKGAMGILAASAVVKSDNPKELLISLADTFIKA